MIVYAKKFQIFDKNIFRFQIFVVLWPCNQKNQKKNDERTDQDHRRRPDQPKLPREVRLRQRNRVRLFLANQRPRHVPQVRGRKAEGFNTQIDTKMTTRRPGTGPISGRADPALQLGRIRSAQRDIDEELNELVKGRRSITRRIEYLKKVRDENLDLYYATIRDRP